MLKQLQKRKSAEGFTIIEVLIVLAIAGLIMVVVFLAVPALQRSGRNNALNTDANNVLSAVGNYMSNNGGQVPASITYTAGKATIGASGTNQETATVGSGTANVKLNGAAIDNTAAIGTIQVITGTTAVCNATGTGLSGAASPRSYAVLFVAESGSGNILKCVGA